MTFRACLVPVLSAAIGVLVVPGLGACKPGSPPGVSAPKATAIDWQPWEVASFERARAEDKLVIIDVGMEGCTACRWMDEKTYTDTGVIDRLGRDFVAIQVDSEARPDVGERFAQWGWPATIFMTPNGRQVLAIRGNKLPKNFIPILDQLVAAKAAGTLGAEGEEPLLVPAEGVRSSLEPLREQVVSRLDAFYDPEEPGWGKRQKLPLGPPIVHAFERAHTRGEREWEQRGLDTLDRLTRLLDPEWGGVFVASIDGYDRIIPEKRISGQAAMLTGFSHAYRLTGDPKWKSAAAEIRRYIETWLMAADGTFYTSQEDDAPALPDGMSAREYYALADAERREFGTPAVDHAVYTHKNAEAISAYVAYFEATGDEEALDVAETAATNIVARRQGGDGRPAWFSQFEATGAVATDARMRPLPTQQRLHLEPQGPMGLALLDLYRVTGQRRWLKSATRLGDALLTGLEDHEAGGFWAAEETDMDEMLGRRKPLHSNAQAARFLAELAIYDLDHAQRWRGAAERAVRAVAHPELVRSEGRLIGELALALEALTIDHVEFTIVATTRDGDEGARAEALRLAALATYEPRKVVHLERPGRYPDLGEPALFICTSQACSTPIKDPGLVEAEAAKFAGAADQRQR